MSDRKPNLGPDSPDLSGDVPPGTAPLTSPPTEAKQPRKRFVGRKTADAAQAQKAESSGAAASTDKSLEKEILEDQDIKDAIQLLPTNYNFEIPKTIHQIRQAGAKRVALQLPEGLLIFATTLSDIICQFCPGTETLIMGDVTYGACCIDDYTPRALGCDMLIHYAHSCLVPINVTKIKTLYVFVEIRIDTTHLIATLERNFPKGKKIAIVGTIQFNSTINGLKPVLDRAGFDILIPQIMPLSRGEVLGCTSPILPDDVTALICLGDGRFHLESVMIQNPDVPAYRYDPYSRVLTREYYTHDEMHSLRRDAIQKSRASKKWGIVLGTLGRQGNPNTLTLIENELIRRGIPPVKILLSEVFPQKLATMPEIECWVQIACPRLSIDWGYAFPRPTLNPYEALVALGLRPDWEQEPKKAYPMDFYAKEGLGRTRPIPRVTVPEV
ncbi:diphthamide biosynthesis protein 1 [Ascosphaera apis ARSEF 7405]|uniref:2-(3-amino-3-carboxypropyl)histidine synthase subunit 1 n=1 Tax=Ascosphaera apis ARSEF 7405 TaxID=392613 RepID=A0A168AHB4_9EURO|nr:diphthamide biosynthesis protein 1 [Ascosphaera apis ARSEF 7405]